MGTLLRSDGLGISGSKIRTADAILQNAILVNIDVQVAATLGMETERILRRGGSDGL